MTIVRRVTRLSSLLLGSCLLTPAVAQPPLAAQQTAETPQTEDITVTASRADLISIAKTASEGSVTQEELDLRPVYRVGQLLESVPGRIVTVHSGEGKANQYLLRGVNLDHGIDFADFIDDMPIIEAGRRSAGPGLDQHRTDGDEELFGGARCISTIAAACSAPPR